jgi:hypothetical protein
VGSSRIAHPYVKSGKGQLKGFGGRAWEQADALLWTPHASTPTKGNEMAEEEESPLANPPTPDVATHVRDYESFTRIFTYGAITCLIIGFVVLLILY